MQHKITLCLVILTVLGLFTGCAGSPVNQGETTHATPASLESTSPESTAPKVTQPGIPQDSDTISAPDAESDADMTPASTNDTASADTIDTRNTPTPVSFYGPLHVSGTALCDANDRPVQLRGVSTHGLGWYPEYVNEDTFRTLKEDWQINTVRLAMYTEEYNGYCSSNDAQKDQLWETVCKGIKAAIDLDMYVIVDWHILNDGNPLTHLDEANGFFDRITARYGDDAHIIYEICNEPNGDTSWEDVKTYAKQVLPIIRKNAPSSVIIIGTPTWCQDVDQAAASPLAADNVVYALHFYADTHRDDLRTKMVQAIDAGLPIFVSEFGICDASGNGNVNTDQADAWISLLNQYNISYIAWNLSNKDESASLLKSSCTKLSDFTDDDLSDAGQWLKNTLTQNDPSDQ